MKKIIPLSLIALSLLGAEETELQSINVESTYITEVAKKAQTSADLADALSSKVPSVDMSRRSGIANDILIRGQKRDNISIEVDGTKVCGACPNRMDPPVSHILASQIEDIEVIEGPYDVETFGTMSGGLKIKTKKPVAKTKAELNFGFGAWGYNKIGATVSGGNDKVRVLVSGSHENSEQYKDGNGNTLAEQVKNYATINPTLAGSKYQTVYENMDAYTKKSLMTKIFINPLQNHEIRLGYTANRSDNVLYPNSKMDAIFDDSDIYNVEYEINNISDLYKDVRLQYYSSKVTHPMSTEYRVSGASAEMVSSLVSKMEGLKLINTFDLDKTNIDIGLDGSKRTWDGQYYKNDVMIVDSATKSSTSIDNAVTENMAIFTKVEKKLGDFDLKLGARYDSTDIENDDLTQRANDYTGFNAHIFATYNINPENKVFLGIGQAKRVPDARELYFKQNAPLPAPAGRIKVTGTDTLEQTTNKQIDLGYQIQSENFEFKLKAFYSMLNDYIYYNKDLANNNFVNIDATIYGMEVTSTYYASDALSVDASLAYKVGEKDKALIGQTDTDLADIAPLRGTLALNYEYAADSVVKLEVQASDRWDNYDSDNGEQELAGWATANFKIKHAVNKKFDFSFGVNNITDATYAASNTYVDLILLTSGSTNVMLLNEPGRYVYTNMDFKF
ncbi:TonB-dependent receptor [Sulfurimonas lithotrophica]|uniref:TonB-dependent receptor n=1 Tax=Sulfurimonas lithotrophica TaxID=2590022 RepID=A0A5P8P2N5_9BACT|nr:TonB-dependent receptor [Sulfurimonas lithotrophica]QFR49926.1 TonB-dependent receptor [Sulfurimonas lithotrophica]